MRANAVLLVGANGAPVVRRIGLLDRLIARLRAGALDRALAAGRSPEAAPAVALRAEHLTEAATRRNLARSLRELVRRAGGAPAPWSRVVPVARTRVLDASPELDRLANLLLAPGPVGAAGVAQVQLLITDGTGPLYNPAASEDLALAAERAIQALEL